MIMNINTWSTKDMILELFRYEDVLYESIGTRVEVRRYSVYHETKKGYWISFFGKSKDKWVSKHSRKRFAYPTKQEAWEGFRARKKRQVEILEKKLVRAKKALNSTQPE